MIWSALPALIPVLTAVLLHLTGRSNDRILDAELARCEFPAPARSPQ